MSDVPNNEQRGSRPPHTAVTVRRLQRSTGLILTLLAIEFLDELVFGAREAAWPLIRDDLSLNYAQVGVLLGVPSVVSGVIEPFLGVLGDVWRRRALVLGGGVLFALALALTALSRNYSLLLLSFILMYPASGAFVSLSQASLMDVDPARHEQNMARWTLAGSIGVLAGPLLLGLAALVGLGWRALILCFTVLTLGPLLAAWRTLTPASRATSDECGLPGALRLGLLGALHALRRFEVLRWLGLLELANLVGDILLGFLALYFVDVVRVPAAQASVAVAVWTAVGLIGNLVMIPLLERTRGLIFLGRSALVTAILFPAFLLVPGFWPKLGLLALVALSTSGWYTILQAQVYSAMPGRSGTVMTVGNVGALVGGLMPLVLGLVAQRFDLHATMWLLWLGPLALLAGLPRKAAFS
jgi:FSR family fosmidomycin resistance protein-like MFS transporter